MTHNNYQAFFPSCRRIRALILAFSFLSGLSFGVAGFLRMDEQLFSLMRGIADDSVSIVCLIVLLLIPLLVSLSLYFVDVNLLFPICFVRAFLFAFVHMGLLGSFGAPGWMIRWLLLFSDCASLPVLYLFWYRRLSGYSVDPIGVFSAMAMLCIIGFFDFYVVTPMGAGLLILEKG